MLLCLCGGACVASSRCHHAPPLTPARAGAPSRRSRGIEFREIDESLPLSAQGPFDAIIHKVREINGTSVDAWDSELEEFMRRHPETIVVDHPAAIRRLSNRASMLQAVPHTLELPKGRVAIPRQLVVRDTGSETIPEMVARAGLSLPLVAKPLLVDGSISSHRLALVTEERGLQALQTPLVLQEFVNHGGVLFKVNVVGESVTVVKRSSLPDWSGDGEQGSEDDLDEVTDSDAETPSVLSPESCERDGRDGVRLFERVSSAKYSDLQQRNGALPRAEAPPEGLIAELSQELTSRLGLQLFNFDLIRDSEDPDNYYVIDINYFPGFAKMPEYEAIFTDFLLNLRKPSERAGHRLSSSALAAGFRKEGCGIEERSVCA